MCVNNFLSVVREAERPGVEPATNWFQVQCPNHYATQQSAKCKLELNHIGKARRARNMFLHLVTDPVTLTSDLLT